MLRLCPLALLVTVLVAAAVACSDDPDDSPPPGTASPSTSPRALSDEQSYPDVVGVEVERTDDGSARFDVTISSPYDTPGRYADAWRIVGPDGAVYGVRELSHDHAGEQPFTRSLDGVVIPDGVAVVTVEGRDSVNGWGGATFDVDL